MMMIVAFAQGWYNEARLRFLKILRLITAYYPDDEEWESDLKTRKGD